MITAIDTNILIDVIKGNDKSIDALAHAAAQGQLIICEIVFAELCAGMVYKEVEHFCKDFNIELMYSSTKALGLAGEIWRKYRSLSNIPKDRVLADFIVAAHAQIHAGRLLTQDRGFYRGYFKDLPIISTL